MPTATLTSKGQVTIPKKIRDKLNLKPGDKINFDIETGGEVKLSTSGRSLSERAGALKNPKIKPASTEDMEKSVRKSIRERYERSRY